MNIGLWTPRYFCPAEDILNLKDCDKILIYDEVLTPENYSEITNASIHSSKGLRNIGLKVKDSFGKRISQIQCLELEETNKINFQILNECFSSSTLWKRIREDFKQYFQENHLHVHSLKNQCILSLWIGFTLLGTDIEGKPIIHSTSRIDGKTREEFLGMHSTLRDSIFTSSLKDSNSYLNTVFSIL
jgi:hypothetical protein